VAPRTIVPDANVLMRAVQVAVIPFGATGYVVLFEVVGGEVVMGAVRHQRKDDYRH
jgi:hypothetical protein